MHRAIASIFFFIAAAGLAGCSGGASEELAFDVVETCLRYDQPVERVFTSAQEWEEAHRVNGTPPAPAIDFSRLQVAGRFDGGGSACTTFSVERVVVDDGAVVVHATRYLSTQPCILILARPQVVVSMPRRDEPVRFRMREVTGTMTGPIRSCI